MLSLQRLWRDEDGFILTAELMLIASILVIGMVVGLTAVRDSVVTELADVGQALGNVDQSFFYSGTVGHHAYTGGAAFIDLPDFCDVSGIGGWGGWGGMGGFQSSKCVVICLGPNTESAWGGYAAGGWGTGWGGGGWSGGRGASRAAVGGGPAHGGGHEHPPVIHGHGHEWVPAGPAVAPAHH